MTDILERIEQKRDDLLRKLMKVDARVVRLGGKSIFKMTHDLEDK